MSDMHIKYEGHIPSKALRAWCDKNTDKVAIVHYGGGFGTDSGMAYEVCLRNGWSQEDDWVHSIIEQTAADVLYKLRRVARCDCESCAKGEGYGC
jgi:hypothetical protein